MILSLYDDLYPQEKDLESYTEHGKINKLRKYIILTKGPVTTLEALKSGVRLRDLTKQQFMDAIVSLQMDNLGTLCKIGQSLLFVKRAPCDEVTQILENDEELCSPENYNHRYYMSIPNYYTSRSTLMKLVCLGMLTEEQLPIQFLPNT